jgi:hypothetical protein
VVVLINAGSQFELFNANEVFSRIPIGIVDILRDEPPPTGTGMTRFYLLFNALFVAIVLVQGWSLLRVASSEPDLAGGWARVAAFAPLVWELGLSTLLLFMYPATLGASWLAAIEFVPDLSVFLLVISLLWLVTGAARAGRLAQAFMRRRSFAPV